VTEYAVRTVRGTKTFAPEGGLTLPHEHILIDSRVWWEGPGDWRDFDDDEALNRTDRRRLAELPQALLRENMILSDWYLGARELQLAKQAGTQLIVDLTVLGCGPNAEIAVRAADAAGIDLVISTGRYLNETLQAEEREVSAGELVERWVGEIDAGINGFLPGVIGEIGTSDVITDAEVTSLRAAGRTQQLTGLPLNIHVHPYAKRALAAIDIVEEAGADLSKVAISHLDCELDIPQLLQILHTGVFVEMDNFGTDRRRLVQGIGYPNDAERIDAIEELCQRGHANRILLSHDINHRNSLVANGGWGYRHIGSAVLPALEERLGAPIARQLTAENPLNFLSIPSSVKP
jgi:phosphotriesterase-related protein